MYHGRRGFIEIMEILYEYIGDKQAIMKEFEMFETGIIHDKRFGLMWAITDNGFDLDWHEAISYCENYRIRGYDDWRMPETVDLGTLLDREHPYKKPVMHHWKNNLPDIITLSSPFIWASDAEGCLRTSPEALFFNFVSGCKELKAKADSLDLRALPVRGKNEFVWVLLGQI